MVGLPPGNDGPTMNALPTLLNALTKRASGNAFCNRSINESFGPVKKRITPSSGGSSLMGLVVSITTLPVRCFPPARFSASSAPRPWTASTRASAHAATSANVPLGMPLADENSASFLGVRLPMRTS